MRFIHGNQTIRKPAGKVAEKLGVELSLARHKAVELSCQRRRANLRFFIAAQRRLSDHRADSRAGAVLRLDRASGQSAADHQRHTRQTERGNLVAQTLAAPVGIQHQRRSASADLRDDFFLPAERSRRRLPEVPPAGRRNMSAAISRTAGRAQFSSSSCGYREAAYSFAEGDPLLSGSHVGLDFSGVIFRKDK